MKKHWRLTALILALALLLGTAGTAAAQADQEAYWYESGRGYLYDTWYYGRGTTLTAAEQSSFFRQHAALFSGNVIQMQYCEGMYGSFYIYPDASYSGHVGYYDNSGSYYCSEFTGTFSKVIRLTPYVYALETNDYQMYADAIPEAIQSTMLLTIPGVRIGMSGALKYEIQSIADYFGLNRNDALPCYFLTAWDSGQLWYSDIKSTSSSGSGSQGSGSSGYIPSGSSGSQTGASYVYGLAINKLATRTGPGTQYTEGGTYNVKGEYIKILSRAYDKRNEIWWVKCEIPYKGEIRVLWTGWKRFDHSVTNLEDIPIDPNY